MMLSGGNCISVAFYLVGPPSRQVICVFIIAFVYLAHLEELGKSEKYHLIWKNVAVLDQKKKMRNSYLASITHQIRIRSTTRV